MREQLLKGIVYPLAVKSTQVLDLAHQNAGGGEKRWITFTWSFISQCAVHAKSRTTSVRLFDGFFSLACEDFGGRFDGDSFPACVFFFLLVEISWRTTTFPFLSQDQSTVAHRVEMTLYWSETSRFPFPFLLLHFPSLSVSVCLSVCLSLCACVRARVCMCVHVIAACGL